MDIPLYKPFLGDEEAEALEETVRKGWLSSSGEKVERLECRLEEFLGLDHGTAVDSGTAALHTALEALDVGKGEEVLVPGITFGATAMAVRQAGAEPVPVDIENERFGISPEKLEERITGDTGAAIAVHLFGRPAEIGEIAEIAESYGVPLVEDAAQAFGSSFRGSMLGSFGQVSAYSFSWNKNATSAKGGFIATKDPEIASRVKTLTKQGMKEEMFESEKGYNYRMDNVRASLLLAQLDRFDQISRRKKKMVETYRGAFQGSGLDFMEEDSDAEVEPWLFYVLTDERQKVIDELEKKGIGYRKFHRPLTELGAVSSSPSLPVSERIADRGLMLPTYAGMEQKDAERVAEAVLSVLD